MIFVSFSGSITVYSRKANSVPGHSGGTDAIESGYKVYFRSMDEILTILKTNRSPVEWAQSLNDEVLAIALLDRLLYKCELIQLSGNSYRMKVTKNTAF